MAASGRRFVQLGATRDGLDPYLAAARRRGVPAVLVETAPYIRWRDALGRQVFDQTIAVEYPSEPNEVIDALAAHGVEPLLVIPGFERYTPAAHAVAAKLGVAPHRDGEPFVPPDKFRQRELLVGTPGLAQPRYRIVSSGDSPGDAALGLSFPVVAKPVDASGGLGVFLATDQAELEAAFAELRTLRHYDGTSFRAVLVEEYIAGDDCSVQGVVRDGRVDVFTVSDRIVDIEPYEPEPTLRGFRERGHVVRSATREAPDVAHIAQACMRAVGYRRGPFHIDLIRTRFGRYHYVEMGFRLSGMGLTNLVRDAAGIDWAEESVLALLGGRRTLPWQSPVAACVGRMSLRRPDELARAERLRDLGAAVMVERVDSSALPAEWLDGMPDVLTSDMLRHGGVIGLATVTGPDVPRVRDMLAEVLRPHDETQVSSPV